MNNKKNIVIVGDSYSTYKGYIPKGYRDYYSDQRKSEPIVNNVEYTWWKHLIKEMNYNLILNDSFSGSTICNTVREELTVDTSFINRVDKYISENYFKENKIDTLFVFGGTNDSWINAAIGELKYSNFTKDDLKCVLPAFCYLLNRIKEADSNIQIVVILNSDLKPEITNNFVLACKKMGVDYIELSNIDKLSGHPTIKGMEQIAQQVKEFLIK